MATGGGNIALEQLAKARDDYYKERLKYLDCMKATDTTEVMNEYITSFLAKMIKLSSWYLSSWVSSA